MPSLRSRRVLIDGEIRPATIRHENGEVTSIGSGMADDDYGDLVVMPGLVDSHVHVNEPGRTDWEGFASATRAAAAGGTTTIVDMPLNSIPPTVDIAALREKRRAAEGGVAVDTAFWGGLIPGSARNIDQLVDAGVCGFKAFMVDSGVEEFPAMTPGELEGAMRGLAANRVPLLLHAEDPEGLRAMTGDPRDYDSYLQTRPSESEASAIAYAARLAEKTGGLVHVLHISSGDAIAAMTPSLSGETCPHYLTFTAGDIGRGATEFKCAPPIRTVEHREALWQALDEGVVSMIVSDHSPAPAAIKALDSGDFSAAWGGIASLQLRLPAVWTEASRREIELPRLSGWLATSPARLAGLGHRKGSIEVGKDADFVVFDPEGALEVSGSSLQHRHPVTPYEGMTLRGTVVSTVLRGELVFETGRIVEGRGMMLERNG